MSRPREQGSSVGSPAPRDSARRSSWAAQTYLRKHSVLPSVRQCRCATIKNNGAQIRLGEQSRRASVSGLKTCGSVWACPLCAGKVWAGRAEQLTRALTELDRRGGSAALITLTMRHTSKQHLEDLWAALTPGWRAIKQSRSVRQLNDLFGVMGHGRRIEVTLGVNGWHLHIHDLVFFDRKVTAPEADALGDAMFSVWALNLRKHGCEPTKTHGLDVKLLDLSAPAAAVAGYITAASTPEGAAREVTDGLGGKKARRGNRTPWQILQDAIDGDERSAALWTVYEAASKGKRALDGLSRVYAALGIRDVDDEELAEAPEYAEPIVNLSDGTWRTLSREPIAVVGLLEVAELAASTSPIWAVARERAQIAVLDVLASWNLDGRPALPPPGPHNGPRASLAPVGARPGQPTGHRAPGENRSIPPSVRAEGPTSRQPVERDR